MSLLSITKKILSREPKAPAAKKATTKIATPKAVKKVTKKATTAGNGLLAAEIGLQLLLSEKSISQQGRSVVVFRAIPDASKGQIKTAVEAQYGVVVTAVRTSHFKGKRRQRGGTQGRTNFWKKAYVTVNDISKLSVAP